MLSKACEYAIKAVLYLAQQSKKDALTSVKEISFEIDSPVAFTAKVMQQLAKEGIVKSIQGSQGGFFIDKKALADLNLLKIVYAIDGDGLIHNCILGLKECSEYNPCPLHPKFKMVRSQIAHLLQTSYVATLSDDILSKLTVLKN